jgi:hypothetical protein
LELEKSRANIPPKGFNIKIESIRRLEDIQIIRRMLKHKPRDQALFTLRINTNLRVSDLLGLPVYRVRDIEADGSIDQRKEILQISPTKSESALCSSHSEPS